MLVYTFSTLSLMGVDLLFDKVGCKAVSTVVVVSPAGRT